MLYLQHPDLQGQSPIFSLLALLDTLSINVLADSYNNTQSCSRRCSIPNTLSAVHLKTCRPCCSSCYYNKICRNYNSLGNSQHHLTCKAHPRDKVIVCSYWDVSRHSDSYSTHQLCHACFDLDEKSRLIIRERRDRLQIERMVRQPLACDNCKAAIPLNKPIWWVCWACRCECREKLHPDWRHK